MPMMGVPDDMDGPGRKKPRLSLRMSNKNEEYDNPSSKLSTLKSQETLISNGTFKTISANDIEDITADLPSSSDPLVPPVASLQNLGNTCFMNCILEVLRYTPEFLKGIEKLKQEIEEEDCNSDGGVGWKLVKNTYQLYADMEAREKQFKKVATCDASSMAVKPATLLDNIRIINPMFEGHFQHDAQELLRCLLCIIEDAHKSLHSIREKQNMNLEVKTEPVNAPASGGVLNHGTVKVETESEVVLMGGSLDNRSCSITHTRPKNRKLIFDPRRDFMDNYFNVKSTCSKCEHDKSLTYRKDTPIAGSSTTRKRKRIEPEASSKLSGTDPPTYEVTSKISNSISLLGTKQSELTDCVKLMNKGVDLNRDPKVISSISELSLSNEVNLLLSDSKLATAGDARELKETHLKQTKLTDNLPEHFVTKRHKQEDGPASIGVSAPVYREEADKDVQLSQKKDILAFTHKKAVESLEEISNLQDGELLSFDSTIQSITNKYFSTRNDSPPKQPSSPIHFQPGPTELIVGSPECTNVMFGGDFSSATQGALVIVHSPFKLNSDISATHLPFKKKLITSFDLPSCLKNGQSPKDCDLSLVKNFVINLSTQKSQSAPSTPSSSTEQLSNLACTALNSKTDTYSRELKMQVKKCDWLGVSPIKSVSASMAMAALANDSNSGHDLISKKKLEFTWTDHKETNKLIEVIPVTFSKTKPARRGKKPKTTSFKNLVAFRKTALAVPEGVQLKPLSIALDKCDRILSGKLSCSVSAKQVLMAQRKNTVSKFLDKCSLEKPLRVMAAMQDTDTLVNHLFGGTMMHRTKCMECEIAKERKEVFMDISVPVKNFETSDIDSDSELEENNDSCLDKLMQALSNVERLRDNNKYFCEECNHYVEAERSCHYTSLPLVLTLHLKRFGSSSGLSGGLAKLNDKVIISQSLPCLKYMCSKNCQDPAHRYSLYGIVTHSGSLLRGHYRAYVKVQRSVNPEIFANLQSTRQKGEAATETSETLQYWNSENVSSVDFAVFKSINYGTDEQNSMASAEAKSSSSRSSSGCPDVGSFWLECDDECISVMNEGEFQDKLEDGKNGALMGTPYILFYHSLAVA